MILILLFVCKSSKFYLIGNVYFYEFDCKGSDFLWFMQINIGICLIFLLNFNNSIKDAIICYAHCDRYFSLASNDAYIRGVCD